VTQDFFDRLVAAAVSRWGLLIEVTKGAVAASQDAGADTLIRDPFTHWWVGKTMVSRVATPFTHSDFRRMHRKVHLFLNALDD
jgi:hypothetical protein